MGKSVDQEPKRPPYSIFQIDSLWIILTVKSNTFPDTTSHWRSHETELTVGRKSHSIPPLEISPLSISLIDDDNHNSWLFEKYML